MIEITLIDVIIPVTSLLAVTMSVHCDNPLWRRWAPIIGMLGQPFWVYETFLAQTWGIFVLSVAYLFVWASGIKKYWWTK
jgi:hypothetical protein